MARAVYRVPPCPAYDVEGMESWLTDMSARGLHLRKDGIFAGIASFTKDSPQDVKYRLKAAPKSTSLWAENGGDPDEEAIAIGKKYGWDYVAVRGNFYIYCSSEPEGRELNTDPEVQAMALNAVRKRERVAVIACFFWAFIYPLIFLRGKVFLTMVHGGTWFVLIGLALLAWIFGRSVVRVLHLRKLRMKLLDQGEIEHNKDWRKGAGRYLVGKALRGILIAVWLGMWVSGWSASVMDEGVISLADYAVDPPFATMADLAPQGEHQLHELGLPSTVREWKDWLAPAAMEWQELARVNLPDGTYISGALFVDYYETISPWLARAIAKEYLRLDRKKGWEEIGLPDLDANYAIAYLDQQHFPTLLIQEGKKVMRVRFMQFSGSYALSHDQWMLIMANSIK